MKIEQFKLQPSRFCAPLCESLLLSCYVLLENPLSMKRKKGSP
uniref:Uncharacterized protein n=1 Tax=Rhizophora mucronata TaxID=61149 RepID=A0A2P2JV50_RHIMU